MTRARDERQLIDAACEGDNSAFCELVAHYQGEVFAAVSRHIPEAHVQEVAQETFLSAYRGLKSFRHDGPFLHWLVKVAIRRCYDYWRARSRDLRRPEVRLSPEEWQYVADTASVPMENALADQEQSRILGRVLEAALDRLSATDRMIVVLVHLEERPVKEVAATLGVNVVALKVRAFRARQRLKTLIEQQLT